MGAGDAHHVAESGEDDVGIFGDGEPVVNPAHRKHAHRAAGTMHQLHIVGKQIIQAEAIDGVRVASAHFHQPVVALGIGNAPNLLSGLRNGGRIAKLVHKFHGDVDSPWAVSCVRP